MKITTIPIDQLKPNTKNVRIHSAKQIEEYKRSLQKNGQLKPIVCDENYVIWIGNGLYEAMKELGITEADCYVKTGMSENDKLKMMMADNKVYELGITDHNAIDEILKELDGDFDIPGYDDSMLEMLTASLSEIDDLVEDYGTFSAEDISSVKRHEENAVRSYENQPQAPPDVTMSIPVEDDKTSPAPLQQAPAPQEAGRFIVCPHCGGQICL